MSVYTYAYVHTYIHTHIHTYIIFCIPNRTHKHITVFVSSTTADVDYISLVQNLTFNGGVNSRTFIVNIENDTIAENDETFEVILKPIPNSPFDVIIGEPSIATGIIFDDEIPSKTFYNRL